jgi:hypothetical protein
VLVVILILEGKFMFTIERRLKKQNEKLQKRVKELEKENWELRSNIKYFSERVNILNEKEEQYNKMLEELEVLKVPLPKGYPTGKIC